MEKVISSVLEDLAKLPELGDYIIEEKLGEGTFAVVVKARHKKTNKLAALKFVELRNKRIETLLKRETKILSLLDHPNIVKFYEEIPIKTENAVCLVLEYVEGGELFDYVATRGKISEEKAAQFFRQIVSAIEYCHFHMVIHRGIQFSTLTQKKDLKLENILLDGQGNVKIADFGVANIMNGELLNTACGSPMYTAPEIINGETYFGPEVDIWSLGVILYVMVTGKNPWPGDGVNHELEHAAKGEYYPPKGVSEECIHLIKMILNPDPTKRATIEDIRSHPWVMNGYEQKPLSSIPTVIKERVVTTVDESVLEQLENLGFEREKVIQDLQDKNTKSQAFVLYQLMMLHNREMEEKNKTKPKNHRYSLHEYDNIIKERNRAHTLSASSPMTAMTGLKSSAPPLRRHTSHNALIVEEPAEVKNVIATSKSEGKPSSGGNIMNWFRNLGSKISRSASKANLKNSNEEKKKMKIKLVKNHFSGIITEHSSETCVNSINAALKALNWEGNVTQEGFKFSCKEEKFGDKLKFEIEVCEVQQRNEKGETSIKYGISFRRSSGSAFHYKEIVNILTSQISDEMK